ncbi:hypothetical protein EI94DRAFT_1780909 [Lactarius quietus]|nr:hypothetical protein EI94DRAFT_1780909 [Lactarius quietus]
MKCGFQKFRQRWSPPTCDIRYSHAPTGTPCDATGDDIEPGSPPPPYEDHAQDNYSPFRSRAEFELAELLFAEEEMSAGKIDKLLKVLSALYDTQPPFTNCQELYTLIDSIKQGDVPWNSFSVAYDGARPPDGMPQPPWIDEKYEVWFRDPLQVLENQIANPDFKDMVDFSPKRVYHKGKHQYIDLIDVHSGNSRQRQDDRLGCYRSNDFYPLYMSLGNVHNSVRHAHSNVVSLIAFLSIPKTLKEYSDKANFQKFHWQLFHTSLQQIMLSLRPHMTMPRVTRCSDRHFRRVIYGLGPYIADYPEQALLACVVQNWCPKCTAPHEDLDGGVGGPCSHIHTDTLLHTGTITLQELWDGYGIVGDLLPFTTAFPLADIHKLLSPDLLHQIIKGAFKDHIVNWIEEYIINTHPKAQAERILADIDRWIAAVPSFPGLQHFHEGRGFKQWMGNDSKGLMKVYLPTIANHVPSAMVKAVAALIEFCYLVRCNVISETALEQIQRTLDRFHHYREIFHDVGIRPDGFSLPRQHSLTHYVFSITQFGAPNGLCSSITESKHIKAIKRPYRRSGRNKPLGQILITNQRIDKLAAARTYFTSRGILDGTPTSPVNALLGVFSSRTRDEPPAAPDRDNHEDNHDRTPIDDPEAGAEISLAKRRVRHLPWELYSLSRKIRQPDLPRLAGQFLFTALNPDTPLPAAVSDLPQITGKISMYNSAHVVFYTPSDFSGLRGMHRERISGRPWRDCVFIGNSDSPDAPGFKSLLVAQVYLFFSFKYDDVLYPCALIHWFSTVDDTPDDESTTWIVEPDYLPGNKPFLEVVHLDSILRSAHLIGVAGQNFLPSYPKLDFLMALDLFRSFYVNKFADHHAHKIAF